MPATGHAPTNEVCQRFQGEPACRNLLAKIFVSFFQKVWLSVAIPPHAEGRTRRHDT
jgi:hypothetical protein